jgi:hypothetical protein
MDKALHEAYDAARSRELHQTPAPIEPILTEPQNRRTPLFSHVHIPRGQLIPLALLHSDPCPWFSAPTLLRLGPMTAFAGIFVQPLVQTKLPLMVSTLSTDK